MKRRIVISGVILLAAAGLTACDQTESDLVRIDRGKACFDAGGSWVPYSENGGHMMCTFEQPSKGD